MNKEAIWHAAELCLATGAVLACLIGAVATVMANARDETDEESKYSTEDSNE